MVLAVIRYQVHVFTGSATGSDTDANVYLNLWGERGDTGKRQLNKSNNPMMFLSGQVFQFNFYFHHLLKIVIFWNRGVPDIKLYRSLKLTRF